MDWLIIVIVFSLGLIIGAGLALVIKRSQNKNNREYIEKILSDVSAEKEETIGGIIDGLKDSFGNLSLEALSKANRELINLAKQRLDSEREVNTKELDNKKGLIDQQLTRMNAELDKVRQMIKEFENDRVEKFGELAGQLKSANEQTAALTQTTENLRQVLANSKTRGQWGERMAEDVLRLTGLAEGINYIKQKGIEGIGTRPDFTFFLPRKRILNMDVKFPLDNYVRFLNTENEQEKDGYRKSFLKDIRSRIKEVAGRDYINPEQNTVDYVLLFIPNEQIYGFIHEQDSSLIDNSLKQRVIFCSPLTLYAVLSVIRQAIDNFALEQTTNRIQTLLGEFGHQYELFVEVMDKMGGKLDAAQREFQKMVTTRKNRLEKPLREIESIRQNKELLEESNNPEDDYIGAVNPGQGD
jgi:DNA recombination protein RmuC